MAKVINLHLISDSTGETLSAVARAVLSQFSQLKVREYIWSLVRTQGQLSHVMNSINKKPGIIMYTLLDRSLITTLREEASAMQHPCIPILDNVIDFIASVTNTTPTAKPGMQYIIDEEYFRRIEAMNFSIVHDDGQHIDSIEEAEIILVGPSRTSKSPTSMYLAHRGFKTANIPYVSGCALPEILFRLKNTLIVGLAINPSRLVEIRETRLKTMSDYNNKSYIDLEKVSSEMTEVKRIFLRHNWPVIDITRKSVEETSATIVQLYYEFQKTL